MKRSYLAVTALVFAGCASLCATAVHLRNTSECGQFNSLCEAEREAQCVASPTGRRLKLYLCSNSQEPPQRDCLYALAEGGREDIPFLLERLKAESEFYKGDIIHVFMLMAIQGHLRGRCEVVAELERVVSGMKLEALREGARHQMEYTTKLLEGRGGLCGSGPQSNNGMHPTALLYASPVHL